MFPEVYSTLGFRPAGLAPLIFPGFDTNSHTGHVFPSILHKDAFLLFRALCKLSMKGPQDESSPQADPIALQNKYVIGRNLSHEWLSSCLLRRYFICFNSLVIMNIISFK